MRRSSLIALTSAVLVVLFVAGLATADRRATHHERRAIARVVELPTKCTKARISTVTEQPRWASAAWKPHPKEKCEPYARDGVAVLKRNGGRWKFITSGSSFTCHELYRDVPREVADDLGLECFNP